MATEAMKRLVAAIEHVCGIDLSQREAELEHWLRARDPTATTEAAADHLGAELTAANSTVLHELIRRFAVSFTRFFRDAEQLTAVADALAALDRVKLHVWIAGCSTGEEAYSLALLLRQAQCNFEITASDCNSHTLEQARHGCYSADILRCVPQALHREFVPCGNSGDFVELSPALRRSIRFVEHNLMDAPLVPQDEPTWDLILCRNVLIYFRAEYSAKTLSRLASVLSPSGYLVLGTSEFHFRSKELTPVRLGERTCLQRVIPTSVPTPSEGVPVPVPMPMPVPMVARAPTPAPMPPAITERRVLSPRGSVASVLAERLLSGRLDAVLCETLPVLMREPDAQPALLLSGIAYHMKGRHHEATALLERTLLLHPSCWPALYFLAVSMEALDRQYDALKLYTVLEECPTPSTAAQELVDLLELAPWKSEAMALARRRLAGAFDRSTQPRRSFGSAAEKGNPYGPRTPQSPNRR